MNQIHHPHSPTPHSQVSCHLDRKRHHGISKAEKPVRTVNAKWYFVTFTVLNGSSGSSSGAKRLLTDVKRRWVAPQWTHRLSTDLEIASYRVRVYLLSIARFTSSKLGCPHHYADDNMQYSSFNLGLKLSVPGESSFVEMCGAWSLDPFLWSSIVLTYSTFLKLCSFMGCIEVRTGGEESQICFDTWLQSDNTIGQCCNLIG